MDLETEIPIWYNGKMKWISNLTTRSTCADVIEAILSNDENFLSSPSTDDYILYESWRGVERPLKSRCRLLKLWHAWAGESSNVTLTLRTQQQQQSTSTHLLLRKQDKKLTKLKRQLKRTDKQIEKFTHTDSGQHSSTYLHLYRSIINTQTQLEYQQKLISNLMSAIENENPHYQQEFSSEDFAYLLSNVNQTLIISRQLTEQSEELDEQIQRMNDEIDRKQYLLDELELDDALDQNIDLDSLDDEEHSCSREILFHQERVSTKDVSPPPLPPPPPPPTSVVIPQKMQTGERIAKEKTCLTKKNFAFVLFLFRDSFISSNSHCRTEFISNEIEILLRISSEQNTFSYSSLSSSTSMVDITE